MKLNFKNIGLILGLGAVMAFQACTDLEPKLYSELDKEQFESSPEAFEGKLGDVYVNLQREYGYVYRQGYWAIQENTTDECFVPVRYLGDWYDDGFFKILHEHLYNSKTREVSQWGQGGQNTWNFMYRGISKCNDMLGWMERSKPAEMDALQQEAYKQNVAEVKLLRAWYHYLAMDTFGNVPWVTSLDPAKKAPQIERAQLFDSIMVELTNVVPQCRKKKIYARLDYNVGNMILAKMYLNAPSWNIIDKSSFLKERGLNSDQACYEQAAKYCDMVIKEGGYSLEPDYFTNFKYDNENSKENIWSIYYDANFSKGMQFHCMTLHYASQETYGLTAKPWNGYCGHHKLMGLYEKKPDAPTEGWLANNWYQDLRVNCWARGLQNAPDVIVPVDEKTYKLMPKYVRKSADYPVSLDSLLAQPNHKKDCAFPPFFTDTITTLENTSDFKIYNIFEGPRFVKFQIQPGVGEHMSNDFPVYRLADAYLMFAEAILRAGGTVVYTAANGEEVTLTTADAQAKYEAVRERAGLTSHKTLTPTNDNNSETMGELCTERCRELMWEGHRRQDLIRFDRFTGPNSVTNDADPYNLWIFRPKASEQAKEIMPLPDFEVDNGAVQNPSY